MGHSSPAIMHSGTSRTGTISLSVFPSGPKQVTLSLSADGRPYEFGPSGRTLYGIVHENCLYKLDLESNLGTKVACPTGFRFRAGDVALSVREDKALIFGGWWDGPDRKCAVFEIALPNGVPKLVTSADCKDRPARHSFTCSLDCKFAKIIHHGVLEVLDVGTGEFHSLGAGFLAASFSPDGKWIAALKDDPRAATILFDGATLRRRKTLPESEAQWSADSHHLLRIQGCWGGEDGTAEALNIDTGKAKPIRSSRCQIYNLGTGWVDNRILPQPGPDSSPGR